jgi:cell division protein FtsQ
MASASKSKQPNSDRPPATSVRASGAKPRPHDDAARRRIQQRQRQQWLRRVRHFELLLPSLPGGERLPLPRTLPRLELRPLWRVLRSRLLWIALAVLAVVGGLTAWVALDERWYVYREDVHFNGLAYLDAETLWQTSAVDGWQIFWIDSSDVQQRLLENPYVAAAQVHVAPLLTKITVDVTEVRPVALWVTDAGVRWLRDDGIALEPQGETPPGLLQILDAPAEATLPGAESGTAIDPAVLRSAQALANRLPGVTPLRYNALVGLNFRLPDQPYWVYWGNGEEVEKKLANLAAAETLLESGEAEGAVIDVRFERPYIK